MMKILSWNVNGLRSIQKKGDLPQAIKSYDPDIVCLQEIKCNEVTALAILAEYSAYKHVVVHASSCKQGGYAGVAIMSKMRIVDHSKGFSGIASNAFEDEGRLIVAKLETDVSLICCYTPNSKPRLERLKERVSSWEPLFRNLIKSVTSGGSEKLVLVGDLNVAPEDIDIFNPKGHHKSPGFTDEERNAFKTMLLDLHLVDGFRHLHPRAIAYTYWSYLGKARDRNKGWRIDHGILSQSMAKLLTKFDVLDTVVGSDHCPILLTFSG